MDCFADTVAILIRHDNFDLIPMGQRMIEVDNTITENKPFNKDGLKSSKLSTL